MKTLFRNFRTFNDLLVDFTAQTALIGAPKKTT